VGDHSPPGTMVANHAGMPSGRFSMPGFYPTPCNKWGPRASPRKNSGKCDQPLDGFGELFGIPDSPAGISVGRPSGEFTLAVSPWRNLTAYPPAKQALVFRRLTKIGSYPRKMKLGM
jgi:hypothetical protein